MCTDAPLDENSPQEQIYPTTETPTPEIPGIPIEETPYPEITGTEITGTEITVFGITAKEVPPKPRMRDRIRGGNTDDEIREGCQKARNLIEWAAEQGFDEQGQQMAPILLAGMLTQDTRLLHSLGGFDKELIHKVSERAKQTRIWRGAATIGNNWGDEETGEISFMLDLMVICGQIRRINRKDEPRYVSLPPLPHPYPNLHKIITQNNT